MSAEARTQPSSGQRARHRGRRRHLLRALLGLVGLALLAGSVALGVGAAWVHGTFAFVPESGILPSWDARGEVRFDAGQVAPPSGIVVIDVTGLRIDFPVVGDYGYPGLSVRPTDPAAAGYLAVAPADMIDGFLAGAPYDVGVRSGDQWSLQPVPGLRAPGDPAGLKAAADQVSLGRPGTAPLVTWPEGSSATVVAGTVGRPGPLDVQLVFTWPEAGRAFLLLSGSALLLAVAGGVLVGVAGGRGRKGRHVLGKASAAPPRDDVEASA